MNISDIITRGELDSLIKQANVREPFYFHKYCKVIDGIVEVSLHTRFIDNKLADELWHGEPYICTLKVNCDRTNNQGGWSSPIELKDFLSLSYEELVRLIERNGHNWCFPENYTYFNDFNEQIGLFDSEVFL